MVMIELLRLQAQTQAHTLTNCVLELARDPLANGQLDACASAARLFEGTAQMAGLQAGAELARTMAECFIAVRRGEIELQQELITLMLESVDLLDCMARLPYAAPSLLNMDAGLDEPPRHTNKRVLVVDDSFEVRELESKLLGFRGYDVITAEDGVEAWSTLLSENIDLVITDLDMPRLDGIGLITIMRRDVRFKRLPVLAACDTGDVQQRWHAFGAGADYYVIKGRLHDTLVEAVSTLIARRGIDGSSYERESAPN
jgi:CheY-like chemotaxis protein